MNKVESWVIGLLLASLGQWAMGADDADSFEAGLRAKERGHYATALRAWMPLANKGIAQAQNNMGHMAEEGLGMVQDYGRAMQWYKSAANQGLKEAQHNVGLLYYQGYGVAKNNREALSWFKLAAAQKLADAEYMVGLLHHNGEGVGLDYQQAKVWFLRSARQNYGPAQLMYAFMLQAGEGQDSEPFKAYVWAKVAAANGQAEEAQAIYDLSVLQLEDDDVPKAEVLVQQCLATQSTDCPQ
jgi:TPR repeat protein